MNNEEYYAGKNLYYAGRDLAKDLQMCEFYDALEANNDVIILHHGRNAWVHEMEYIHPQVNAERRDTGKTHLGFGFHFITFYYDGRVWNVEPSPHYPFTDENYPKPFCVCPFKLIDGWYERQEGYYMGYESLKDCRYENISSLKETMPKRPIPYFIVKEDYDKLLSELGGYREKAIYEAPHICFSAERTDEHHIVRCAKLDREPDGTRLYFDIDMKTKRITN